MSRLTVGLALALLSGSVVYAQEIVVPLAPASTPVDQTLPRAVYDCALTHVSGERLIFKFQVSGGRGYQANGRVTRTNTVVTILSDPSNVFAGYVLSSWDGRELRGLKEGGKGFFGAFFVGVVKQADQQLTSDFSGRVVMTVDEHRPPKAGMDPYSTATGFCEAVRTPQKPLSESELAELDSL